MKNAKPLSDLEMYELLKVAYPERFPETTEDDWDDVLEFAEEEIFGFEDLADLLGRVVMIAPVMNSVLGSNPRHCLGDVRIIDGQVQMTAAVSRECIGDGL